jgi:hypothetical protein
VFELPTWLYLQAVIVVFCAEINTVRARRLGPRTPADRAFYRSYAAPNATNSPRRCAARSTTSPRPPTNPDQLPRYAKRPGSAVATWEITAEGQIREEMSRIRGEALPERGMHDRRGAQVDLSNDPQHDHLVGSAEH